MLGNMETAWQYKRALLLLVSSLFLVVCSGNTESRNFFKRFSRQPQPPPPPPTLSEKALQQAREYRDEALEALEKRSAELEREGRRLTKEIDATARKKGSELKEATLKEVEAKRLEVQMEAERLSKEAKILAQEMAAAANKKAREKLLEIEKSAKSEAKRLAGEAETIAKRTAKEAEQAARRGLASLEKTTTEKVSGFFDSFGKAKEPPQKLLPASVADKILNSLQVLVLLSSVGNLLGPSPVLELWDNQGFGDEFFPFQLPIDKRILAGILELCGFLLLTVDRRTQIYGSVLLAVLFGRGSLLNLKRELWQMVFPGVVSALALSLIANELMPPKKTKKDRSYW